MKSSPSLAAGCVFGWRRLRDERPTLDIWTVDVRHENLQLVTATDPMNAAVRG
jgi:hypothetical protein